MMPKLSSIGAFGREISVEAREFPPGRAKEASRPGAMDAERRRFSRVPLALRGRYMLQDGREYPCVTRDVSRMGVGIQGVPVGAIGERVIAYLEKLGRIEGRVVRRSEDWFAIEIIASPNKLDRIDDMIGAIAEATGRDRDTA